MYYRHFGLSGPPFQFTPSTSVLYLGKAHRECLAALEWALLNENCGFMLLLGETGVGKTTLLCSILARELTDVRLAYLTNPKLSFEEIMRVLLKQLGSSMSFGGRLELIEEFERIVTQQPASQRIAVVIDEAQDLSDESLEDVRLLANCADSQISGLQFVLMGQPELLDRLSAPNLRQIRERVGAKAMLVALSRAESIEYIECRLTAQQGKINRIFDHDALLHLVAASAGIPRRLNVLCHNALLVAYSEGAQKVELRMAQEVVKDFESIYLNALHAPAKARAPRRVRVDAPVRLDNAVRPETFDRARIEDAPKAPVREPDNNRGTVAARNSKYARPALAFAALFVIGLGAVLISAQNATGRSVMRSAGLIHGAAVSAPRPVVNPVSAPIHEMVQTQPKYEAPAANLAASDTTAVKIDANFVPSTPTSVERTKVQVRSGDTMHDLAQRYLGAIDRTRDLIVANPQIKNPDVLYPGDAVYLPSSLSKSE